MLVITSMQSQGIWGDFCQAFVKVCISDKFLPVPLGIVMDTQGTRRNEEVPQTRRDTNIRQIIIGGAVQAMSKSRNWLTFLSDGDNKKEFIQFIADYCNAENFQRKLKRSVATTCGQDVWLLDTAGVHQLPSCNYQKADTRITRHVILYDNYNLVLAVASYTEYRHSYSPC